MSDWSSSGWTAIHDHMPPGPKALRVSGTIHAEQSGYEFTLRPKRGSQGINPRDFLMELDVQEPEFGSPVMTDYSVAWEDETETEYDTVSIIGVASGIEVQHPE